MYIETIPRRLGGLADHLMQTGRGSNETVIVRTDLSRDMPLDVALGLRILAASARRIGRMKRDVVHIVVAPERQLSPDEVENVLRTIEVEYGIAAGSARIVVEHQKGDRAPHFHVIFSMKSEANGKALRFARSGDRDEMLARRLEIELNERLQPSTRVDRTVELLRERGLHDLADIAAKGPRAEKGQNQSKAERQQARRLEADTGQIDARLLGAWRKANREPDRLRVELEAAGFRLAAGKTIVRGVPLVRLIDVETLNATSLTRHLNRITKANGETARVHETEIGRAVGELRPETEVKNRLRREAPQRSADDLLREYDGFVREMESDGQATEAAQAKKARGKIAARLTIEERQDLQQQQTRIRARYRQRDRIRRARVNRGFIGAGVFASPAIRKMAFYMVTAGVMATGAGLIAALVIAGVAVASLPSYASAKRLRAAANQAAAQDRFEQAVELKDTVRRFFRERAAHQRRLQREELQAREIRVRTQIHRTRGRSMPATEPPPVAVRPMSRQRPVDRRGGPER